MVNQALGKIVSDYEYQDLVKNHQYSTTTSVTGEDVIRNFKPKSYGFDGEVSSEQVFRDLDNSNENQQSNTSEGTTYKITFDGATDSVKYFFREQLESSRSSRIATDEVDTGPVAETPSKFQRVYDVTTEQNQDTTSKRQSRESEFRYKMNYPFRGCFIIFSQEEFDLYNKSHYGIDLPTRKGTRVDAGRLEDVARHLGFEFVKTIHDATGREIRDWIVKLAEADHSQYDCFGCAILTHGNDRDILYARDEEMKLSDFTRLFGADRCPSLAMKPKLFFIQACRGSKLDPGKTLNLRTISADQVDSAGGDVVDGVAESFFKIPAEADFLIANSTVPEYYSFRNTEHGSIFIQSVYSVFTSFGDTLELMQLMTRVNRMMAFEFQSNTNNIEFHGKKQIPSIATRLTAEVYFRPKKTFEVTEAFQQNDSSKSKMEVDSRSRTEPSPRNENVKQQEVQSASLREATYAPPSGRNNSKTFNDQPRDKVFPTSSTAVQESSHQGYRSHLDIPQFDIGTTRGRSSSMTLPHRIKSEGEGQNCDDLRMHKSPTEPQSIQRLRAEPGNRLTMSRRSLPEVRRLVKQETNDVLIVGGMKTNVRYEESDL